jgi:hypothetical protein
MGVKLGLSHCRRNIGYGCFENVIKRHMDQRRKREQRSEEECISRIFMICTPHQIKL